MSNSMSVFWKLGEEDRRLIKAKNDYLVKHKPQTYAATHPAYKGTSLQAKHGGNEDAVR